MSNNDKQNKELQILSAAETEFLTKGYDGARTTSIAKAAGVTHAMLHYYFRTKEQLFERIVNDKFKLMAESMLCIFGAPSQPLIERIRNGICTHFDFIAANPLLPRFVINEIITDPHRHELLTNNISKMAQIISDKLQKEIDEAAQRGEIAQFDCRMLFISIASLNLFSFIAYPIIEFIHNDAAINREAFLAARKAENVETIMRRIKIQQP